MRLVHPDFHFDLDLKENQVNVLVAEAQDVFAKLIFEILGQTQGKEGRFILSDCDKIKNIAKETELVLHPFALDCNEKRIQQKLFQLISTGGEEEFVVQTGELNSHIVSYIDALLEKIPYGVVFEPDLNVTGLLKLYAVRIDSEAECLLEQVMNYLRALREFCHIAIVFFVNLKTYLGKEELIQLYEFAFYQKMQLVLLENAQRESLQGESICILDKDMCIIEVC